MRVRLLFVLVFVTGLAAVVHPAAAQQDRPNIVFLFADDLGYGDIACYGAPDAKTPHLDRLAEQGVRFTQHYSNGPECTPTRTALLTGRYQQRIGGLECAIGTGNVGRYDDAIRLANKHQLGLPPAAALLPRAIQQAGYATACFGKWHLGYEEKFNPILCGFDEFFGCLGGNVDYFTHRELSDLRVLYRNQQPVERKGYMTHLIADDAVDFIRRHRDKPFFLYVPFTSPHFPFQAPGDEEVEFNADNWTKGTRAKYVQLVEDLDAQIGRILKTLADEKLENKTLVVFASDNGAMAPGRNKPFRDYKSKVFEGGIRVPLIARWPGHLHPGKTSEQMCITMDLTRSFLRVAGVAEPSEPPLDGIDILRHVEENDDDFDRMLFWRGRRGERTEKAVRYGDWKYIHRFPGDGSEEEYLFNLSDDPAEEKNLLEQKPEEAQRLRKLLATWEKEVKPPR